MPVQFGSVSSCLLSGMTVREYWFASHHQHGTEEVLSLLLLQNVDNGAITGPLCKVFVQLKKTIKIHWR